MTSADQLDFPLACFLPLACSPGCTLLASPPPALGCHRDAIALDYPQVTVLSDATASATHGVQLANLHDMRQCGVDTPTVAEWAAQYDPE